MNPFSSSHTNERIQDCDFWFSHPVLNELLVLMTIVKEAPKGFPKARMSFQKEKDYNRDLLDDKRLDICLLLFSGKF